MANLSYSHFDNYNTVEGGYYDYYKFNGGHSDDGGAFYNNQTNTTGHVDYPFYNDFPDYYYYFDFQTFYHEVFTFEEIVYLYVWPFLVILTTIANILVILVLMGKSMRTSTNIILIAIAVSDSMTGLITLPAYMHAYNRRVAGHLLLTKAWCEYFMLTKLFLTRAFHTMSVWLTLVLGFQRLISVSYPFKAQLMFSIKKTTVMIAAVALCSPILHIYQLMEEKTVEGDCQWHLDEPCEGDCVYIWLTFYLAHFIPCILLIAFTVVMVIKLRKATEKMSHINMISNEANMRRRNAENRRISVIVVVIVILFLIPEIPYSLYLVLNVSLKHARKKVLSLKSNRVFICSYEILMVLTFHANFWVYMIMNRKFRRGVSSLFRPCLSALYSVMSAAGVKTVDMQRRRQSVSSFIRTFQSDAPSSHQEPASGENSPRPVEMKMYNFDENGRNVRVSGSTSGPQ